MRATVVCVYAIVSERSSLKRASSEHRADCQVTHRDRKMAVDHVVEGSRLLGFSFPLMMPLILATVTLAVLHVWLEQRRIAKIGNRIPGPSTLPILGNAHYVINKNHHGECLGNKIDPAGAPWWLGWLAIVRLT